MSHNHEHHADGGWIGLTASGALLAAGLILHQFTEATMVSNLLLLIAMIVSGFDIARGGLTALVHGRISIDLLITIAAVGALAIGHLEEGASVLFLFNLAELLEDYAADRARHAIETLMELKPEVATLRRDGEEVTVAVEDVWPGEVFVLRPGDRVPLDGLVVEGSSSMDQATITGESTPVSKLVGEEVYAGTINLDGFLAVRVTKLVEETMLARILRMVEEAEESRSPTEAFVDRFAALYTPSVILLAVAVAAVPTRILHFVLPRPQRHPPALESDGHRRLQRFQEIFDNPMHRLFYLDPAGVQLLIKIARSMKQGNSHHGDSKLGR